MSDLVGLDDLRSAAARIAGPHLVSTPLVPVAAPVEGPGFRVDDRDGPDPRRPLWVKAENLQRIGAFKIRGALNALGVMAPATRRRGVVTSSSGNHGQALAYAARAYGVEATVVVPEGSAPHKLDAIRRLDASVITVPPQDRDRVPVELAAEHGYAIVPPFDHRDVIAGQGTIGLELVEALPEVATVLVPVGGGGLISGVAAAVRRLNPRVRVIGVEPELAADVAESMRLERRTAWPVEQTFRTIADGVRTPLVGELNWAHITEFVDRVLTVSEEQILDAIGVLARRARLVAEPSGAVATAGYLAHAAELPEGPVVAIVSGGNIEPALFASVLSSSGG